MPLTKDNHLFAKKVLGDRVKLSKCQNKFHECTSEIYPKLKLIPVRLFKQATALTAQMEQIKEPMNSMGAFNLSKKKESVMEQLTAWILKVGSFDKWIKLCKKVIRIRKTALKH